jgi:ribosomal protein S6--L-glutamate ligase
MKMYFMLAYTRSLLRPNPVLVEMFERLEREGIEVELGVADELVLEPGNLYPRHDLYVLKSHTELWISLAGILHSQGAEIVNAYPACLAAHNKIVAQRRLEAAGIPTPTSWVTGKLDLLTPLVGQFPLVLKPYHGGRGAGVCLVRTPAALNALAAPTQPMLIQRYMSGDEIKVYVIGDEVFGVKKTATPGESQRYSWAVSDEIRALALRCGQVFGLGLYGLDVIVGPEGPAVIDVNYFPSYKGVPNAAALLARYLAQHITARRTAAA